MKLRIKETGELLEDVKFIDTTLHKITIQYLDDGVLQEQTRPLLKTLSANGKKQGLSFQR